MEIKTILTDISRGRTDYIFYLFKHSNWQEILREGQIKPLQLVYYNEATGLRAVIEAGGTLFGREGGG